MNKNYPKITIVTPCYNHEQFIAETIESVLGQNYPNLEYIVIDDGSTDQSWDIIQQYKKELTYLERREGYRPTPVESITYGFSKGSGEIMGWLNSKNTLIPKSTFILGEIFSEHPSIEWLTGLATSIDEESKVLRVRPFYKNRYDFMMGNYKTIQQESTFWRRSLWERSGAAIPTEYSWGYDVALWSRFFRNSALLYHVNTQLGTYRKLASAKSLTMNDDYSTNALQSTKDLKKQVLKTDQVKGYLYSACSYLRHLFTIIPHRVFSHKPFRQFGYPFVEYRKSSWKVSWRNPFRLS